MDRTDTTLSHFRIVARLSSGSMGEVYRAEDILAQRTVAIKILPLEVAGDPERGDRFNREAISLAALNHPNVITLYSVEESEGVRFLVTEFVEGKTLDTLIPPAGLPLRKILELGVAIADGLSAAHGAGIVHRDLKPSNVMVSDKGQVKILDFGLAKVEMPGPLESGSKIDTRPVTGIGQLVGTILYMSPEQVQGTAVDHRSDIFSFGVLLFEMSTGKRPFEGQNLARLLSAILRDDPPSVKEINPRLPEHLAWLIAQCMKKEPAERLQSMLEIHNELNDLLRLRFEHDEVRHSIAVLPFQDMSPERDQEYFCEGIAEELIHALNKLKGIRVASRTSSFHYRNANLDVREIGKRLNAGQVLEGSVRKSGSRIRITAELINIADGYALWSERFDRDLKDVFAIQDEIAQSIARALETALRHDVEIPGSREFTPDIQAYDYYLRGRKFYYQYDKKGIEFALQMFTRAIELDAGYARAYCGIADCCCYLYANAGKHTVDLIRADEASRKALELAPDLAEAHASRAVSLSLALKPAEAEKAFDAAIRLDPKLFEARYFYARHCFAEGKLEKAARLYEQASHVRPEDYQAPLLMAQIHSDLGRTEEAAEARRRGIKIAEEHLKIQPDDIRALYMGANGLVAVGDKATGLVWAGRALNLESADPMVLYNLACIYSLAGEQDLSIDCLEKALEHGFSYVEWAEKDSNLDPIRNHPRFKKVMAALGKNP